MKLFGLTARVLATVLVFGVLTPILPVNAAPSPVTSPATIQSTAAAKAAPKNTKAPTVSGTTRVPNQLRVKNGTWSGAPTSYTYQWFRCTATVKKAAATPAASCSTVGSATAAIYTLTDADAGKFMVARVSGVNASGTVSIHSASTAAITPRVIAPKNTVAATISGTAQVSRVLTASNGTWSESPVEFSYQWYQCSKAVKKASSSLTKGCTLIANQTDSTYQLASNDAGKFVLARVSASNNAGSASVFTSTAGSVAVPRNYAPTLFAAPSMEFFGVDSEEEANAISGSPFLGSVLVASKGQWLGYPLPEVSYSSWFRCDLSHTTASTSQPVDCEGIPGSNGANGETYLVSTQDVGKYLAFGVIAVNSAGTIRYFTPTTNSVVAIPTLLNPPVLSGTPRYGQNLSVTDGRWSVASGISMTFGYRWFRCDSGSPVISDGRPDDCAQVAGQDASSYLLSAADLGKFIIASVTATNPFDESVVVASNVSLQVLSTPTVVTAPTVSGTRVTGNALSVSAGSWAVYPAADSTYQWYRCNSAVSTAVATLPAQCSAIEGETSDSYALVADDAGKFVTVATGKSNDLGSLSVWSVGSAVTNQAPVSTSNPQITGILEVGELISATPGSWMSYPTANSTISWKVCDVDPRGESAALPPGCEDYRGDVAIGAGADHTCAVAYSGTVDCWGLNDFGQLGVGNTTQSANPVRVSGISNAVQVDLGARHTCAVLSSGGVSCWGRGTNGELGNSATSNSTTPVSVTGINNAVAVSVGERHSCALLSTGAVNCWGLNSSNQMGNGSATSRNLPGTVTGLSNVEAISAGASHSCALLSDQTVKCWGAADLYQTGIGATNRYSTPQSVSGLTNAISISSGSNHSCAVLTDGTSKCWGNNSNSQIGNGLTAAAPFPTAVGAITNVTAVAAGSGHTCALLVTKRVKCWGYGLNGELGSGAGASSLTPVEVLGLTDVGALDSGGNHVCALVAAGGMPRCWGWGGQGQIGNGLFVSQHESVSVGFPDFVPFATFAIGKYLTAVFTIGNTFGSIQHWNSTDDLTAPPQNLEPPSVSGTRNPGETLSADEGTWMIDPNATGSTYQWYRCDSAVSSAVTTLPAQCSAIDGATSSTYSLVVDDAWKFVTVAVSKTNASGSRTWWAESKTVVTQKVKEMATGQASCALFEGGFVKCWGNNAYGAVGDGTTVSRLTPVDVAGLENVESISSGPVTCAVLTSGSLECWGNNASGQLGDGTKIARSQPEIVSGLTNVVSVSVGDNHSCVVLADTSVKCWGSNGYGQLGDGSNVERLTPVTVTGLTNVVSLAMGNSHSCAMLADGSAKCWGNNSNGQLGDGSEDDSLTPVTVSDLSNVVSISAGDRHSCALLAEGSVKCWGDNYYGQIGRGEPSSWDRNSPADVMGIADAVMVASDADYSCAVFANGTMKCWGSNQYLHLGIDRFGGSYNTPQDVYGITSAMSISAGPATCAVLTDGSVMCWGINSAGQVGDGTTTSRSRPVSVGFQ